MGLGSPEGVAACDSHQKEEGNTAATAVHTPALANAGPRQRPHTKTPSLGLRPQRGPGGAGPQPLPFTLGRDPGFSLLGGLPLQAPPSLSST